MTSSVCAVGRTPTEDEKQGIAWWNVLPEHSRLTWLAEAQRRFREAGEHEKSLWGVSAADAWAAYKDSL